jgi:hypothetical protein
MEETLPEGAWVVRGGLNLPEQFEAGSGVTKNNQGKLHNISVTCAPNKTINELSYNIPNRQIGVTTVTKIRAAGAVILPAATRFNPDHCLLSEIDAQTASTLFTPTIANPNRKTSRGKMI